jgi:hypothetical protein
LTAIDQWKEAAVATFEYSNGSARSALEVDVATGAAPDRHAAVHLLLATELPNRDGFAALVEIIQLEWEPGDIVQMGSVRDWAELSSWADTVALSDDDRRMVALAVSIASGRPVDLATNLVVKDHLRARRIIEAVGIATGHGTKYAVVEVPPPPRSGGGGHSVRWPVGVWLYREHRWKSALPAAGPVAWSWCVDASDAWLRRVLVGYAYRGHDGFVGGLNCDLQREWDDLLAGARLDGSYAVLDGGDT